VFRRHRQVDTDALAGRHHAGDSEQRYWSMIRGDRELTNDGTEVATDDVAEAAAAGSGAAGRLAPAPVHTGPWDGSGEYPPAERLNFGSLLVPVRDGIDVQVNITDDVGMWVAVVRGDSALQLQAFAAPKKSGIWEEVRAEIAEEIGKSGGTSSEAEGPFGTELRAQISAEDSPGQRRQPVRFIGVDGPRWFLRGVLSGPAAAHPGLAKPFEELFADVVVVRGEHPAPPKDLLEIRLPEDAAAALEEQIGAEQDAGGSGPFEFPDPFQRGPEITETR
jgi:hypothetical protein